MARKRTSAKRTRTRRTETGARYVSLKPIATVIKQVQRRLERLERSADRERLVRIQHAEKQLKTMTRELMMICRLYHV